MIINRFAISGPWIDARNDTALPCKWSHDSAVSDAIDPAPIYSGSLYRIAHNGILVLAALVGATDIDPFVINIAQGGVLGISPTVLSATILIAASSNNIAKAIYALSFGGFKFSRRSALMLFVLAMLGFAAAAIYILPLTQTWAMKPAVRGASVLPTERESKMTRNGSGFHLYGAQFHPPFPNRGMSSGPVSLLAIEWIVPQSVAGCVDRGNG
jgi:hypothetical protein